MDICAFVSFAPCARKVLARGESTCLVPWHVNAPTWPARTSAGAVKRFAQNAAGGSSRAEADEPPVPTPLPPPELIASAVSTKLSLEEALEDATSRALLKLKLAEGQAPSLAIVYVSSLYTDLATSFSNASDSGTGRTASRSGGSAYSPDASPNGAAPMANLVPLLRELVPGLQNIVGCTVSGVIGSRGGRDTVPSDNELREGPSRSNISSAGAFSAEARRKRYSKPVPSAEMRLVDEIEKEPGVSVTFLNIPGIGCTTFAVTEDTLPDLDSSPEVWEQLVFTGQSVTNQVDAAETVPTPADVFAFLVLTESDSVQTDFPNKLLQGLDYAFPRAAKLGGEAAGFGTSSGSLICTLPRDVLLRTSSGLRSKGAVGVAIHRSGPAPSAAAETGSSAKTERRPILQFETLISHGCRAVGPVFVIEGATRRGLLRVRPEGETSASSSMTAGGSLKYLFERASKAEQTLIQSSSLYVGVMQDTFQQKWNDDDVVLTQMLGVDAREGSIELGNPVRSGQLMRYFVVDAFEAKERLQRRLSGFKARQLQETLLRTSGANDMRVIGVWVIADRLRGKALYREECWETDRVAEFVGGNSGLSISGLFSAHELGSWKDGSGMLISSLGHSFSTIIGVVRYGLSD
ncbi:Uncharacterized protein FVE85_0357 [Porphyridium purpureum]|uniref:FIST domain-containing protein n=1 Tax=Porphyridium purpureum TaxID=35688 RepID=A0A5J4YZV4_PORPP|nr:Uncharacterized protein FVE85_0357 [Porphyridium purpureum]|eukprot:POR3589..scf208_2